MRAIRVLLFLLIAVVGVFIIAHLSGQALINDHRLAHAIASYSSDPTDSTRQEVEDATDAGHHHRTLELLEAASVLLLLFGGVVYLMRIIRGQTISRLDGANRYPPCAYALRRYNLVAAERVARLVRADDVQRLCQILQTSPRA